MARRDKQLSLVVPIFSVAVRITLYIFRSKLNRPAVEMHVAENQGPTCGLEILRSENGSNTQMNFVSGPKITAEAMDAELDAEWLCDQAPFGPKYTGPPQ